MTCKEGDLTFKRYKF